MSMPTCKIITLVLVLALAGGGLARAQLLGGGVPAVGGLVGAAAGPLTRGITDQAADAVAQTGAVLRDARAVTVERLLRRHRDLIEADPDGQPVVRGEILAIDISDAAVALVRREGFTVTAQDGDLEGLGLSVRTLTVPRNMPVGAAVRRLEALDPQGRYEFNHLFQQGGEATGKAPGKADAPRTGAGLKIGMVDGAAAASRPALLGVRMVQQGFAPGAGKPSAHGTAVASLIAGVGGGVQGSAPGAALYIADVYGTGPTGGSAQAVARGLAWLAQENVPVINISLVGPKNLLLQRVVERLTARGVLLVAAIGNDGPAAAPLYPAAFPGVIAVTGVDARGRVLPEASRGAHVDFAAPGIARAAAADGGALGVRGTSFAAPVVAGRLARLSRTVDPAGAARAVAALGATARDLGAPGPDPVYGRGMITP